MKWSSRSVVGLALSATLVAAYFAPEPQAEGLALSDKAKASAERHKGGAEGAATTASAERTVARAEDGPVARQADGTGQVQVQVLALRSRDGRGGADGANADMEAGWFGVAGARPRPVAVQAAVVAPAASAAPEPGAPALPFKAFGRYLDGGEEVVFLMMNDQNLAVRVGDTIAQNYRVERLEGNTLSLRYLPLDVVQTLNLGGETN